MFFEKVGGFLETGIRKAAFYAAWRFREAIREDGRITFQSTAHPVFLAENLTQILIMLKGLKAMAENPMLRPYAESSAKEIWGQLSVYAKERILFVLRELLPEDCGWYEAHTVPGSENRFHTEEDISREYSMVSGNVIMDCLKNDKPFCVEYRGDDGVCFYQHCVVDRESFNADPRSFYALLPDGKTRLEVERIIRSTYTLEELVSD